MKQYYSDVVQFTGSHYDFGYMQGELLKESPILMNRKRQWASRRNRHFIIQPEDPEKLYPTKIPGMYHHVSKTQDRDPEKRNVE